MKREDIVTLLRTELTRTSGCTDPGVVCFAVARARRELGFMPDKMAIVCSLNIYKNGINVGIPGTDGVGIHLAAALGAVTDRHEDGLAILEKLTPAEIEAAKNIVSGGNISVTYTGEHGPLFTEATLEGKGHRAIVRITGDYTHVALVSRDGVDSFRDDTVPATKTKELLKGRSFEKIAELIVDSPAEEFAFLLDAAHVNKAAAITGINGKAVSYSIALDTGCGACGNVPTPCSAASRAKKLTGAAGEARMLGLQVPVMALTGSGNQGITSLLGTLAVAEAMSLSREMTLKGLAISAAVTVLIKSHLDRLTTICGCAVAAATGVTAGTVYLLGGTTTDMVNAMHSVIGTLAGMICDGAKVSCAYKLSAATDIAVQYAHLALNGAYIPMGNGIVGYSIDETIANLALLNNPGMVETDRVIMKIIESVKANEPTS